MRQRARHLREHIGVRHRHLARLGVVRYRFPAGAHGPPHLQAEPQVRQVGADRRRALHQRVEHLVVKDNIRGLMHLRRGTYTPTLQLIKKTDKQSKSLHGKVQTLLQTRGLHR